MIANLHWVFRIQDRRLRRLLRSLGPLSPGWISQTQIALGKGWRL